GSTYVLSGKEGDVPYGGLPKAIARIMAKRAELDGVTAHVLRHSFASVADELGYTEATVAALLGQRSESVTRRYIHQLDRALIAAADRVSANIWVAMTATPSTAAKVIPLRAPGDWDVRTASSQLRHFAITIAIHVER